MESEAIGANECATCGTIPKVSKRLPVGWKRRDSEQFCPTCWAKRYVLRAISVPVTAPIGDSWDDLRTRLRSMWSATTQAANWMVTELFARDVRRGKDESKMQPMPRIYLYPEARARFPELPSQTLATLENAVSSRYRKIRYKVIWTCQQSLPSFRYPMPYSVPNRAWRAEWDTKCPVISLQVGDSRMRLRLKGGLRFQRQRRAFGQIVSGAAIKGELALYESGTDVMCKLVAWLPREERTGKTPSGILRVRTDVQSLIVALDEKGHPLWIYNGDQIPRWIAEHRKQLLRWSEDQKPEHRPVPPFAERRVAAVEKYHNRMNSICHQVAAMITGYAARRSFAKLRYDDSVKDFCPEFVWVRLRSLIAEKLNAAGIELEVVSGEGVSLPPKE